MVLFFHNLCRQLAFSAGSRSSQRPRRSSLTVRHTSFLLGKGLYKLNAWQSRFNVTNSHQPCLHRLFKQIQTYADLEKGEFRINCTAYMARLIYIYIHIYIYIYICKIVKIGLGMIWHHVTLMNNLFNLIIKRGPQWLIQKNLQTTIYI